MRVRAAVITFPGSNCDEDSVYALRKADFEVEQLWHKDSPDLSPFRLVLLPGGFSYGDYLRCGAIAAHSPISDRVRSFAGNGGFVLGMCNGFQILCEMGLLPGALARNESLKFVCKDVFVKIKNHTTVWTSELGPNQVVSLPIAHGDGRYVMDGEGYETLTKNGQIILSYCDAKGEETAAANPNGSSYNIAGVCNEQKNVFGLMPHLERATDLRDLAGSLFWKSFMKTYANS